MRRQRIGCVVTSYLSQSPAMLTFSPLRRMLLALTITATTMVALAGTANAQATASLTGCQATFSLGASIGDYTPPPITTMYSGTIDGQLRLINATTGKPVTEVEQGATFLIAVDYVATSYENVFTPHGEFAVSDGTTQIGEKLKINDIVSKYQHTASTGATFTANQLGLQTITATLGVASTFEAADYGDEWIPGKYTLACAPGMTLSLSAQFNVVPAKPGVRAISLLPSKATSGGKALLKYRIEGTRKPTQERVVLLTLGGKALKRETSRVGKNPGRGRTTYEIVIPRSIKPGSYAWCVSTRAQGGKWSDYKCAALTVS
jgi:hypothetical protein